MRAIDKLFNVYEKDTTIMGYSRDYLHKTGISKKDLQYFLHNDYLTVSDDNYYITDTFLAKYARKIKFYFRDNEKAKECFLKCLELNPKNKSPWISFFIDELVGEPFNESSFNRAVYYFDKLSIIDDYRNKDNNFYLFLLNYIDILPEDLKCYLNNLELNDFLLASDDTLNEEQINTINSIRKIALNFDFGYALHKYNDYASLHPLPANHKTISRLLLFRALQAQKLEDKRINILLYYADYVNLMAYLERLQTQHSLSKTQELLLISLKSLFNLIIWDEIPEKKNTDIECNNFESAIKCHDYEKALSFTTSRDLNKYPQFINLLTLICDYTEALKVGDDYHFDADSNTIVKDECYIFNSVFLAKYYEFTIKYFLRLGKYCEALTACKKYLNIINKIEYEEVVTTLIKLYVSSKKCFNKAFTNVIYHLHEDNFEITDYLNMPKLNSQNTLEEINRELESKLNPVEFCEKLERTIK